ASLPDDPGVFGGDAAGAVAPGPRAGADAGGRGPAGGQAAGRGRRGVLHLARADRRLPVRPELKPPRPRPAAVRAWDAFFFTPADPTPLALIRIVTGLLLLWNLAILGLDLRDDLGSDGWADPATVRELLGRWSWSFWLAVPDSLLWPAWVAC